MTAYAHENFRAAATSKILANAYANMRTADNELGKLRVLCEAVEELARIGEDGSYPFDDLTECAIITHGIDADLAQTVVSKGIEAGLLPKLPPEQAPSIAAFQHSDKANGKNADPVVIDYPPYIPPDPAKIPKREWLYGRYYIRGVVSATLGRPGRLKSTVSMTDAVSMTVGLDLLNDKEPIDGGPLRVAYINGEENQDELDRRCAAICQRYEIKPDAYQGRLWLISTRDKPLRLAVSGKGGVGVIAEDVVRDLETWCDTNKVDVLMFDPIVSFHRVRENDPGDMDTLYKEGFGRIAGKTRAVDLVIHPRKPSPGEVNTTMDDLRGTGAQEGALRAARILNFMTTAEAEQLGIEEEHRRLHVRIEGGKNNPGPIAKATWVKIETQNLPNGDTVAVATPWNPPNPFDDVTTSQMQRCRNVAQGGAFRADSQAKEWFGYEVAKVLGIDLTRHNRSDKREGLAKVKQVIKRWLKNKVLDIEEREDSSRRMRSYIIPGTFKPEVPVEPENDLRDGFD
jgi:hypothetical protein